MAFDVKQQLRAGGEWLGTTSGLALAAVLCLLRPPTTVVPIEAVLFAGQLGILYDRPLLFFRQVLPDPARFLSAVIALAIATAAVLVVGLLTLAVVVVVLRTVAADNRQTIPRSVVTTDVPLTLVYAVLGSVVYAVLVSIGTALLVVPGVYVGVSLALWPVFVAVEGDDPLTAFRRSWRLADGNRWSLLAVGFATLVITALIGSVAGLVGGWFLEAAGIAIGWVFAVSVLGETYRSLVDASTVAVGETTDAGRPTE